MKRSERLEQFIDGSTRKDDLCGEIEILRNDAICADAFEPSAPVVCPSLNFSTQPTNSNISLSTLTDN